LGRRSPRGSEIPGEAWILEYLAVLVLQDEGTLNFFPPVLFLEYKIVWNLQKSCTRNPGDS